MLITLRSKMGNEEFIKLKHYCHDVHIPKGTLETKENAYDIFVSLKELGKIRIDDTKLLEELLEKIGRTDLVTIVEQYHQGC
ncbi:FAS-associated death domain protein-like [Saccoglossus kowalevskii]